MNIHFKRYVPASVIRAPKRSKCVNAVKPAQMTKIRDLHNKKPLLQMEICTLNCAQKNSQKLQHIRLMYENTTTEGLIANSEH